MRKRRLFDEERCEYAPSGDWVLYVKCQKCFWNFPEEEMMDTEEGVVCDECFKKLAEMEN